MATVPLTTRNLSALERFQIEMFRKSVQLLILNYVLKHEKRKRVESLQANHHIFNKNLLFQVFC